MAQLDAPKLKARIDAFRISLFTLASLVATTEQELHDLVSGELEEERARELRRELEQVLRLEEDALAPPCTIPDERARKATAKKIRAARKALGSAIESCRTGRGKGFCETMEKQLASLDQLDQELEGEAGQADDADDES